MNEYSKLTDDELRQLFNQKISNVSSLNNKQMAFKILINSLYGATGSPYFRYFDIRIAEAITLSGQLAIRWIANKLNSYFNKVLGEEKDRVVLIDTDSVVLTLEDLVQKVCPDKTTEQKIQFMDRVAEDKIQPFIDASYQELADYTNAYEQKMHMKRENLVDTMISVSKKRYVMSVHNSEGVQYKEPQMKVMGLQMVKSSTPSVIRDKLKQSLEVVLRGTELDLHKYCSAIKSEFAAHGVEKIAFPRSVSNLQKYASPSTIYTKGTPIHVRGSLLYNRHVEQMGLTTKYPLIQDGDKIKFVYLRMPNPIREDCIAFIDKVPVEFGLEDYIDYTTMYEKTFVSAIEDVIASLGWHSEPRATLEDFFE